MLLEKVVIVLIMYCGISGLQHAPCGPDVRVGGSSKIQVKIQKMQTVIEDGLAMTENWINNVNSGQRTFWTLCQIDLRWKMHTLGRKF